MNEPDFEIERRESVSDENESPADTALTDVSLETATLTETVSPARYEPDAGETNNDAANAAFGTAKRTKRSAGAKKVPYSFMKSVSGRA